MSLVIKEIQVPKTGYIDVRIFADGKATVKADDTILKNDITVKEIISPHGRLLDEQELLSIPVNSPEYWSIKKLLQTATTIMEEE